MATKKNSKEVEVVGLLSVEKMKEMAQESKSLYGAIKAFWRVLNDDCKDAKAIKEIKRASEVKFGNSNCQTIQKILHSICKDYAPKQLANGTIISKFRAEHTNNVDGVKTVTFLFDGYQTKEQFGIRFVADCWNRYLKGTAVTFVKDEEFYTADQKIVRFVEECNDRGLDVSEQKLLAYDMIKNGAAILAEAV